MTHEELQATQALTKRAYELGQKLLREKQAAEAQLPTRAEAEETVQKLIQAGLIDATQAKESADMLMSPKQALGSLVALGQLYARKVAADHAADPGRPAKSASTNRVSEEFDDHAARFEEGIMKLAAQRSINGIH